MWQLAELVCLSARPQETHNLESFSDVTRLLLPSSPAATQRPARSLGRGQTGVVALPVSPPKPTPPPSQSSSALSSHLPLLLLPLPYASRQF